MRRPLWRQARSMASAVRRRKGRLALSGVTGLHPCRAVTDGTGRLPQIYGSPAGASTVRAAYSALRIVSAAAVAPSGFA
jgi:hypothetical protein